MKKRNIVIITAMLAAVLAAAAPASAMRDPAQYTDGMNLYQYVRSAPTVATDPSGLRDFHPVTDRNRNRLHYPPALPFAVYGDISGWAAWKMHISLYDHYILRPANDGIVLVIGGRFLEDVRKVGELKELDSDVQSRLWRDAGIMLTEELALGESDTFSDHGGRLITAEIWRTNVRLSLQGFTVFWSADCEIGPKKRETIRPTWFGAACRKGQECGTAAPFACDISWTLVDTYDFQDWEVWQRVGRPFEIRGFWETAVEGTVKRCADGSKRNVMNPWRDRLAAIAEESQ